MASKLLTALLLLYFPYTTYAQASGESPPSHELLAARSQSRAEAGPHDRRSTGCFYLDGGRSGDHFFQWVKLKISGWSCKEKLRETVKSFCDSDTEEVELVSKLHGEPGLSYDRDTDICTMIFIFTSQLPLSSMNDSPLKGPECGRMALWCTNPQKPMADHCVSVLHRCKHPRVSRRMLYRGANKTRGPSPYQNGSATIEQFESYQQGLFLLLGKSQIGVEKPVASLLGL